MSTNNDDAIVIFLISSQIHAIQKLYSKCMPMVFAFSFKTTFYLTKTENKIFNITVIILFLK